MYELIVPLLFYLNGFGIKYPTKFDMLLNKEIKPIQIRNGLVVSICLCMALKI